MEYSYKDELVAIIRKHFPQGKIYLFGSRARGKFGHAADIDIALDTGKPIDISIIGIIKEDLEESTIPFFVDVVDFNSVCPDMQEEIMKDGILWSF